MVDFEFREHYSIDDLRQIVALLRHPGGCPWDREQTHESLRRCLTEECCEVLEAIDRKDDALLCEELGDVLLQVVFHASLAEDGGRFTLDDVADGVCKKMIFRHPHVFGTVHAETTGEVLANWDALKREEKGIESDTDVLRAVARTLPALWRAEKVLSKAAKAGFPWPDAAGALDALDEQTQALRHAAGTETEMRAALGDALFAAAAAARWAGADPEELLHEATDRYISRFSRAEQTAKDQGRPLAGLGREEQLQAWNHAKEQKNQQDVQEDKKMNKQELISAVAEKTGFSKKDTEATVNAMLDTIASALEDGEKVQFVGFGSFEAKARAPRIGRNPKTREAIEIPASKAPVFKPSKALKDLLAK